MNTLQELEKHVDDVLHKKLLFEVIMMELNYKHQFGNIEADNTLSNRTKIKKRLKIGLGK